MPPHASPREQMQLLLTQSRAALIAGELDQAEQLLKQAEGLRLPESMFGPGDDRPYMVSLELQRARSRAGCADRRRGRSRQFALSDDAGLLRSDERRGAQRAG